MIGILQKLALSIILFLLETNALRAFQRWKASSLKYYLHMIAAVRRTFLAVMILNLFIGVALLSFAGLVVGILILLPISLQTKAIILLSVAALLLVVSILGFFFVSSERIWIRIFRADLLIKKFSEGSDED